jgi:hypothetical protein
MDYICQTCAFFEKKYILIFISTNKFELELKIRIFIKLGHVPGLRVLVLNVQILDSWHFEVQV